MRNNKHMERFISFLALSIVGISFSGCLSEQELAERARQTALNNFKIELCADEPARWRPALKKLFTLVDQGDADAIELFLDLTSLTYNKRDHRHYNDEKLYPKNTMKRGEGPSTIIIGKSYVLGGFDGITRETHNEWIAYVSSDCAEAIKEKCFELADKNISFATKLVASYVKEYAFWSYSPDSVGVNSYGLCIRSKFWCEWGMRLIDNKSDGALDCAFDFAWMVGNSSFKNRGISSGWGDPSFDGISGLDSYAEKFFTDYADKGHSEALSMIFWALTTDQEVWNNRARWKYNSRALDTLKNLALAGNKDAVTYLIRIMKKESAQSHKSNQYTGNHFVALQALVEIQKKTPNTLIHNALMNVKNETTDTDVYEYIENNYR